VAGVFVLRRREPALARPYRAWGYPVTPLVYVALACWTLGFVLAERPRESLLGLATVLAGVPVWAALRRAGAHGAAAHGAGAHGAGAHDPPHPAP
jgi:APA family basic amino acid/polyamine antiporter